MGESIDAPGQMVGAWRQFGPPLIVSDIYIHSSGQAWAFDVANPANGLSVVVSAGDEDDLCVLAGDTSLVRAFGSTPAEIEEVVAYTVATTRNYLGA